MVEIKKNFTIGKIFGETFNLYFQNFIRLIIPAAVFSVVLSVLIYLTYSQIFRSFTDSEDITLVNLFISLAFLGVGILFLPFNCYQIQTASNCFLKKTRSPSELIGISTRRFFPLLGMTLLLLLGETLAAVLLIIPAYILMIGWSLNYVVFVLEGNGAVASLKRSWKLTKGYKGKLFLIYLILIIILYAIIFIAIILGQRNIAGLVSGFQDGGGRSNYSIFILGFSVFYALGFTVLFPLFTALLIVVYYNILKDKEGFATEQLAEEFMSE